MKVGLEFSYFFSLIILWKIFYWVVNFLKGFFFFDFMVRLKVIVCIFLIRIEKLDMIFKSFKI